LLMVYRKDIVVNEILERKRKRDNVRGIRTRLTKIL
jgi:hypothetical protein